MRRGVRHLAVPGDSIRRFGRGGRRFCGDPATAGIDREIIRPVAQSYGYRNQSLDISDVLLCFPSRLSPVIVVSYQLPIRGVISFRFSEE